MRLHKYLAHCGVGSLRKCEEYIKSGLISLNGEKCTELGKEIQANSDVILFRGKRVKEQSHIYIILNKPRGYVTTVNDPQKRLTVIDLIRKSIKLRVYPVGRLDINTTGILILTNDGVLTNYVITAKNMVHKLYVVKIRGKLTDKEITRLKKGIRVEQHIVRVDRIFTTKTVGNNSWIKVIIHSGQNRIIREIFNQIGHPVSKIHREKIGNLSVRGIPLGGYKLVGKKYIYKRVGLYEENK